MICLKADHLDIRQIAASGQCFRMRESDGGLCICAADRRVTAHRGDGVLQLDCRPEEEAFWRSYFDLDTDYGAFVSAIDPGDDYLKAAADFGSGIRILRQDL